MQTTISTDGEDRRRVAVRAITRQHVITCCRKHGEEREQVFNIETGWSIYPNDWTRIPGRALRALRRHR